MHFGKNVTFHPNLDLSNFSLKIFPKYFSKILSRNNALNPYLYHLLFHHQWSLNFYGLIKTFKLTINVPSFLIFEKIELTLSGNFLTVTGHCWDIVENSWDFVGELLAILGTMLGILKGEVFFVTKYEIY